MCVVGLEVVGLDGFALDADGEQGHRDRKARAVLAGRAVHQGGHAVLGQGVQYPAVLGRALQDDLPVGSDHAVGSLAVGQDRPQLVRVAVAHHPPELRTVRRVGERDTHVAHAGQLHVQPVQLVVGLVAEVEDGVQPETREERGVLGRGVCQVTTAVEPSVPHPAAVRGGQAAHVTEIADTRQFGLRRRGLRQLLRHGHSWRLCHRRVSPVGPLS